MQIVHQDDAFKREKCCFLDNIWVFLALFSLICHLLAYWFFPDWTFTSAVLKAFFGKKSQRFILLPSYWHLLDSVPPSADFQGTGVPCPHKNPPRFHWGERGGFDANNSTRPRKTNWFELLRRILLDSKTVSVDACHQHRGGFIVM